MECTLCRTNDRSTLRFRMIHPRPAAEQSGVQAKITTVFFYQYFSGFQTYLGTHRFWHVQGTRFENLHAKKHSYFLYHWNRSRSNKSWLLAFFINNGVWLLESVCTLLLFIMIDLSVSGNANTILDKMTKSVTSHFTVGISCFPVIYTLYNILCHFRPHIGYSATVLWRKENHDLGIKIGVPYASNVKLWSLWNMNLNWAKILI